MITVAGIDGVAYGGGAELATACDYRCLNKQNGKIRFVQALNGLSTGWGGGRRLRDLVGREEGLSLLLSGSSIEGKELYIDEENDKKGGLFTSCNISPSILGSKLVNLLTKHNQTAEEAILEHWAKNTPTNLSLPIVASLKLSVDSVIGEEETESFKNVWGGDLHVEAFANALKKK